MQAAEQQLCGSALASSDESRNRDIARSFVNIDGRMLSCVRWKVSRVPRFVEKDGRQPST
jgi:hypothetical protein